MLLLGHRGSVRTGGPAENTLAAAAAALDAGADGVEVDVRLTADGVPACVHDADLRRVAGVPEQVARTSWARLRRVRLAGGLAVPRLADVLDLALGRGLVVLDVKGDAGAPEGLAAAVLAEVSRARRRHLRSGARADLVVSSFSALVLAAVRDADPRVRTALVTGPEIPAVLGLRRVLAGGVDDLHPHVRAVLADHILADRAREHGRALRCWTVNRSVDARLLDLAGAEAAISDDPAGLRVALAPAAEATGVPA